MQYKIKPPVSKLPSLTHAVAFPSYSLILWAQCKQLKATGLCVNPSFPHLGVSPDGLISCDSCGLRLLEIKWPYSVRNATPDQAPYLLQPRIHYHTSFPKRMTLLSRSRTAWNPTVIKM